MINYDYPQSSEDYIHRIGRTGRSSQTGTSYAFFTRNNSKQAKDLISVLQEANQEIDPELLQMSKTSGYGGGGRNHYQNSGSFKRSANAFSNRQSNGNGGSGGGGGGYHNSNKKTYFS